MRTDPDESSSPSPDARSQDVRQYTDGPVTEVNTGILKST